MRATLPALTSSLALVPFLPAFDRVCGALTGTGLKGAADASNRAEINELVLKLEPMNPTESAASSPLLNGVWELLYTGG
jgi:hypothetical protein